MDSFFWWASFGIDHKDQKPCPFCAKAFRCLGKHLAHCPARQNQPYQQYLAQKSDKQSLTKEEKILLKKCPSCKQSFKRLDVHLLWNAACRDPLADKSSVDHQLQQPQHSELSSDARSTQPAQQQPIVPPYHPKLKPPLKIPPTNAIDDWDKADQYIRHRVVPHVIAEPIISPRRLLS